MTYHYNFSGTFGRYQIIRWVYKCRTIPRLVTQKEHEQNKPIVTYTGWAKKTWTCLRVDNSAMVTRRKACNMPKVLECFRQKGPYLHSKSFKYSLPNLPQSSLPLKLGICLHSHVPEFIELKNSLPKSPDLNSVNYSVCGHCNR